MPKHITIVLNVTKSSVCRSVPKAILKHVASRDFLPKKSGFLPRMKSMVLLYIMFLHYIKKNFRMWVKSKYYCSVGSAYCAFIFTHYAMLQCSYNLPIMLNIMLKKRNCCQTIYYAFYMQFCISNSLHVINIFIRVY